MTNDHRYTNGPGVWIKLKFFGLGDEGGQDTSMMFGRVGIWTDSIKGQLELKEMGRSGAGFRIFRRLAK